MNKKVTKNSTKITIRVMLAILAVALLVVSSVGIYFATRDKNQPTGSIGNPLDWAVDEWDGESSNDDNWLDGDHFGNRGERVYTIDSVESFIYFVSLVNNEEEAQRYDNFMGYTVYLNTNIDLKGYSIDSIGKRVERTNGTVYSTFQGTFDGSYYTIYNGNIVGNGLFGYVENATIKNVGLYNCTITGEGGYVGGIVGEAVNTDIENTYVSHGSINGDNTVAGIVGKYTSNDEEHYISNSFADTTINGTSVAGLVGDISADTVVTISNSYYTNQDRYNVTLDNQENVVTTNVIRATSVSQFYSWDYAAEYNLEKTWCNYSYRAGSTELSFNYPVLTRFNKVFMTGSCYENTVNNESTGEIINAETISQAFESVSDDEEAEVNIIVERVFMEDTAVASGTSTVTLNTSVNSTLVRGDSNPEMLVVGAENSTLILGDESADIEINEDDELVRLDTLPTLTLDGQKDYVKENNLRSGALVYAQGYDFEMYSNVVVKDNINNTTGYGGGVFINSLNIGNRANGSVDIIGGGVVENCEAIYDGGGVCVVWSANSTDLAFNISNCTARNGGGIAIMEDIETNETSVTALTRLYGGEKFVKPTTRFDINSTSTTTLNSTYNNNTASSNGGGAWFQTTSGNATLVVTGTVNGNSATNGGGVYAADNDTVSDGGVAVNVSGATINANTATTNGGGVYSRGTIIMLSGSVQDNSAGEYGGGLYRTDSTADNGIYGVGTGDVAPLETISNNVARTGYNTYAVGAIGKLTYYWRTASYGSSKRTITVEYLDTPNVPTVTSLSAFSHYGWSENSANSTTNSSRATTTFTETNDCYWTFYAIYQKSYTKYMNGASTSGTSRYSYNSTTSASKSVSLGTSFRTGYSFHAWTTTSRFTNNTSQCPTLAGNGGTTVTQSARSATYYAVYRRTWTFYRGNGTTTRYTYYMYNVSTSASYSQTYSPTRSGYTFEGWSTSSTATSASSSTASSSSSQSNFYAVWYDSSADITTTSTLTHTFYTGSGTTTDTTTLTQGYRNARVCYNYNLTHSRRVGGGSQTLSYSRLSYRTASRSGYSFEGWTTSSTGTSASWTSGTRTPNSNTSYYAVWSDTGYTRYSSGSLTHRFYTDSGTSTTRSTTYTTTYTGATRYFNYSLSSYRTTGGTAYSTSYGTLSYQTASRSGYTFEGWTTSSTSTSPSWTSGSQRLTSSRTYYAVWSANDGTRTSNSTLTHRFYTASGTSTTETTTATTTYTGVPVNYNYSLEYSSQSSSGGTASGTTYGTLSYQTASRDGYTFEGWTTSSTGTSASWTSGTQRPTAATTYYAVWSRSLTLRHYYDSSNYYTTSNTVNTDYDGTISSITANTTSSTPSLSGFTFYGWATSSASEGTSTAPTTYTSRSINVSEASTTSNLYAVWRRGITYYYNGTNATTYRYYPYNTATGTKYISISSTARAGYALYGYTTTSSFTNNTTTAPSRISYSSNVYNIGTSAASTTAYAVYYRTWTFNVDGDTTETRNAYYMYNVGENASYSQDYAPSKSGYTFVGWTTTGTGTDASSSSVSSTAASVTSYAVWRDASQTTDVVAGSPSSGTQTYTLTFNGNGSTGGSTSNVSGTINITYSREKTYYKQYNYDLTTQVEYGTTYGNNYESGRRYPTLTLPSNGFTRTGYTFTSWALGSATGTKYAVGAKYTPTSGTGATMYAVWDDNDYTLTFNANGGKLTGNASYTVTYNSTNYNSMASILPTREGYTFDGWYTAASAGTQVYNGSGAAVEGTYWVRSGSNLVWHYTGSVTLYAHWTARTYNVTTGMSTGTESITVAGTGTYGQELSIAWEAKADTAQYTYTLANVRVYSGTDENGTLLASYATGESATFVMDETYYPNIYIYVTHVASVNNYTVTIVSSNTTYGTVSAGQVSVPYGSAVQTSGSSITIGSETVNATANTGYHFDSWDAPDTITGATTITAEFAPNTNTAYTVRHYQQNIYDDGYTLVDTDNLTGTTGAQVTPSVNTYTGFISPSAQRVTIAADGSTVVTYNYTRRTYTINLEAGEGVASLEGAGVYRYEQEITINAVLEEGYIWRNWTGTTTIASQEASITVTQNMTLTANADIGILTVTITAGVGGQVSESELEVMFGTVPEVEGNVLRLGDAVVTATPDARYEFDSFLNVPDVITEDVTITAQFAEIVNITIEVEGTAGEASYGVRVNDDDVISASGTVRRGSKLNIIATTEPGDDENNNYQIVSVFIDDVLRVNPASGTIDGMTGTEIASVNADTTIRFVFSAGYRLNVSSSDNTDESGIDITVEQGKMTNDGIIAVDADVTITIDEDTLRGADTNRTYIGMVYTLENGKTVSVLNGGDDIMIPAGHEDGLYNYEVATGSVVKEIHVIVKAEDAINVEIPDSEEIIITSAEGFVKDLETGENVIFEGRWYITSTKDSGVVTTIFGEYMPELETEGEMAGYYYFEL